jgi:hypothetical protein
VPPQSPSLAQVATHALLMHDMLPASPQSAVVKHATQVFVVVSQCGTGLNPPPPMQFMSDVHWTHCIVVVLQMG